MKLLDYLSLKQVDATVNSGPREDATRIGSAGAVCRQVVDIPSEESTRLSPYNRSL
ncbi:hypothetical protein QQ045_003934 [Rhodiola kirilowii]